MKKILAIIVSLLVVAALFTACTETPEKPVPTEAPQATEAPVADPTAEPDPTPTAEPDPTPLPFADPYKVEIYDWVDGDVENMSFDTIFFDNTTITDGGVSAWKAENDETVDGTDGKIGSVGMRGWAGFTDEEIVAVGYQIDERLPVFDENGIFVTTEPAVKNAGGEHAQRFRVDIPVAGLYGSGHELKAVVKTDLGDLYYVNPDGSAYLLYYDGPAAAENAVDGEIKDGEYVLSYAIDSSNAKTWTGSDIGDRVISYHLSKAEDGVYVAIEGKGALAGDMLQINFNPGARIDEAKGLFLTFQVGGTLKVLQHNHKTALKDDDSAAGAEITDLVEAKLAETENGFIVEAKIPADFFKVTDVEGADEFDLAKDNLYFGMFVVLNTSEGFTNQPEAPAADSDWTAKSLGLHEYVVL